jgi:hypothetical protein
VALRPPGPRLREPTLDTFRSGPDGTRAVRPVGQMTTADPSRSSDGSESLWAYTHLPRGYTVRNRGTSQLHHNWCSARSRALAVRNYRSRICTWPGHPRIRAEGYTEQVAGTPPGRVWRTTASSAGCAADRSARSSTGSTGIASNSAPTHCCACSLSFWSSSCLDIELAPVSSTFSAI